MNRFFIIGNPRSGTTLLRLMLNKHSKIVVPPEAGFLIWLHNEYKDIVCTEHYINTFIESLKKTTKIQSWNLDYAKLIEFININEPHDYAELIDCVYYYYARYVLEKDVDIYGDKNNFYLNHIEHLSKLYDGVKFIHIVRDGRSVAVSYKNLSTQDISSKYAPQLPIKIEEIAKEWVDNISMINSSMDKLHSKQCYTIKFEDLILEPNITLLGICEFLEVTYDEEMLNYFQTSQNEGLEPQEFIQWKSKNLLPLQKKEAWKYRELPKDERDIFEEMTKSILNMYEYQ